MSPETRTSVLAGQHVVVIGGSSGIGLAIAAQVEREGARVTIMARDPQKLKIAAASLKSPTVMIFDLREAENADKRFVALGSIDHLVISGGTLGIAPIAQSSPPDWRAVLEERVVGPLAAIKVLASRISTSIVLFSGTVAHRPFPGGCLLAVVAAAIEGMTRELALELSPLRVNAIAPGLLDTPMTDRFLGAHKQQVFADAMAKLPARYVGTAADAADVATFLMKNRYITGSVIGVDGGSRLI